MTTAAHTTLPDPLPGILRVGPFAGFYGRFEDGPLAPTLVIDAYRYWISLAREHGRPANMWLFGRYPAYSFYQFDERALIALYSNTAEKKDMPAFEVSADGLLGQFLASEIDGLRRECRKRSAEELEGVISRVSEVT